MAIIYRTSGAWGVGKGANLDAAEIDENFWQHEQRIDEMEENPPEANQIANITQTGAQITIHMEDGTTYGPFNLPRALQQPTLTENVTAATLTPTAAQASHYFRCSHAVGCAVTIPPNSAQAFLDDSELHFRQSGAGALSFIAGSGVTLNVPDGFLPETAVEGAVVTAKKVATNEWDLFGLLAVETTA